MADEETPPEASPPPAPPAEGVPEGEPAKKKSMFAFLSNKIVMIAGAVILGGGLGAAGMHFAGGGKPAKAEKADHKEKKAKAEDKEAGAEDSKHGEGEAPEKHEKKAEEDAKAEEGGEEAKAEEGHGAKEGGTEETKAEGEGEGGEGAPPSEAALYKFEPVIVNVVEKNSLHYLKLQMAMECSNPETMEEIKLRTPELRDALLFLINDMTLREILSSAGKAFLKEDIRAAFNKFLKKGEVKKIYFTDFTIQ